MKIFAVIFIFCFSQTFAIRPLCVFHPAGCEFGSRSDCLKQLNITQTFTVSDYDAYPPMWWGYRNDNYLSDDNREKACHYELCMKKKAEIIKEDGSINIEKAIKKFGISEKNRDKYTELLLQCQEIGNEDMCDKLKCLIKARII